MQFLCLYKECTDCGKTWEVPLMGFRDVAVSMDPGSYASLTVEALLSSAPAQMALFEEHSCSG